MSSTRERTFIMIKPDSVQRGLIGKIITRFEEKGLKLIAMKFVQPGKERFEKHYLDLLNEKFYLNMIDYVSSGPVVAMVWQGSNAVAAGRRLIGCTRPEDSFPGTIRADFALALSHAGKNVIHGSDTVEFAEKEISLWFEDDELQEWSNDMSKWID